MTSGPLPHACMHTCVHLPHACTHAASLEDRTRAEGKDELKKKGLSEDTVPKLKIVKFFAG